MSLQQWLDNSWISRCEPSAETVSQHLRIAERNIADASLGGISPDGRFDHAYDAVRCLCELALHACGYSVPKGQRQHERIIESIVFTIGGDWAEEAGFLDQCRRQRNKSMYDRSDVVRPQEADELLKVAQALLVAVRRWLEANHSDLV